MRLLLLQFGLIDQNTTDAAWGVWSEDILAWISEGQHEPVFMPSAPQLVGWNPVTQEPDVSYREASRKPLEALVDLGIDCMADITLCTVNGPYQSFNHDTPQAYMAQYNTATAGYETLFGACLDYYEELGSHFKGYTFEHMWDNGLTWLKTDHASKTTCLDLIPEDLSIIPTVGDLNTPPNYIYTGQNSIWWRVQQVNEIAPQFFTVNAMAPINPTVLPLAPVINYVRQTMPSMPIGVVAGYETVPGGQGGGYWIAPGGLLNSSTTEEQKVLLAASVQELKLIAGKFDFVMPYMGGPSYYDPVYGDWNYAYNIPGTDSLTDITDFYTSLNLTSNDARQFHPTQLMSQRGFSPTYVGAVMGGPNCVYVPGLSMEDTFTNTGNEIIMLKSWSGTTSHTITVSGTTRNGLTKTQSYTRTLSPLQGTPLGPFPPNQFGSNITITYDNTNLYVAIVGET